MLRLHDFAGTLWTVSRAVDDRRAGTAGEFRGTAVLRPQDDGLRYEETGRIRLGDGPAFSASRRYLWLQAGDRIEVRFEDGRPFHSFAPQGRSDGTDHPCGADLYRVQYDFAAWPVWTARWTVTGPAKDYVLTSRYEPAGQRPPGAPEDPAHFQVTRLGPKA